MPKSGIQTGFSEKRRGEEEENRAKESTFV
jgi:hypothetical protein